MATRYPIATALSNIDTVTVAEALIDMFSDKGIPNEILSDKGTQFTSDMMKEVHRLLSIKAISTSPYHAMCNGLCEKYNGTLKQMLKRMIEDSEKEWDRYINPLLFAYREVQIDSLGGFSPFELLYGRIVRGPMAILREMWSREEIPEEVNDTYEYVLELRRRLESTCEITSEALKESQKKQKEYYDKKSVHRVLERGQEVLILLPTDRNKLIMRWKGPFAVTDRVGTNNYAIKINEDKVKVFHINMLKEYFRREAVTATVSAVTFESDDEDTEIIEISKVKKVETHQEANINPELR